ncbi:MAG: dTDP-4-dehydro-6-deoxyglucose aminotransferase [Terriglobia bacterium]|nr:MAG: dTDP-4-dehydro-6-deoxyglucose aminotransferase [Terriglobia bacterium]
MPGLRTAKTSISDLAIFGGRPAFAEPLHVGRPNIGNRERLLARFNDLLDRRWLTNGGPFLQEFEERLADYLGVPECIAICNGTIALEIAIRALGLAGEVLVPSFTFIATAHALQWQHITPVFCDIDRRTHHLNPELVESRITPQTTGILGVHLWGEPCAIEALTEIANRRRLALLFDASHAFGCSHRGRMIGNFGRAEVFSFHATKCFNTFEGGAVATGDRELAARIRLMRSFGFADYDEVVHLGTNGKMSEVAAAMGLTGLESLDEFIDCNRANYRRYQSLLAGIPGLCLHPVDASERRNYQYVVIEVDEEAAGISRDLLQAVLAAENVLARRYFYPGCHRMEPYRSNPRHATELPETERLSRRVLTLPTGTAVDAEAVETISHLLRLSVENAAEMSSAARRAAVR